MEQLLYIGFLAPLLPMLFFILFKRKSKERAVWVIFFYILYCVVNEFVSYYLQSINSYFILYLFSVFTIVELSFISWYFYIILKEKYFIRKAIIIILVTFTIYGIFNIAFSKEMDAWDSIPMGIESLIILVLSSYYLFTKIRRTNNLSFYSNFYFWMAITFLIYFSGTFFMNIMLESMRRNPEYQMFYVGMNIGFNIIKSAMLAVAMTMRLNKAENKLPNLDDHLFLKNA